MKKIEGGLVTIHEHVNMSCILMIEKDEHNNIVNLAISPSVNESKRLMNIYKMLHKQYPDASEKLLLIQTIRVDNAMTHVDHNHN